METRIFKLNEIDQAAQAIKDGQLVAFPTETVYGLGADATNEAAVKNVYLAKGRPSDNPLIVHVASIEMVERYAAEIPNSARQLMKAFWPGSLTIILKIKPGSLSKTVTGGLATVAFRYPDCQPTLDLILKAGVPIVGPSANTSGKPSPTTAQHVFHDLNGKIFGILDNGPTRVGVESTVLDLSTPQPAILRPETFRGGAAAGSGAGGVSPVTSSSKVTPKKRLSFTSLSRSGVLALVSHLETD